MLVPSEYIDMRAGLSAGIVDESGHYVGGYAGDTASLSLLDRYKNSGIDKVSQKSVLTLPIDKFSSKAVAIDFWCVFPLDANYIKSRAGLKLYYKRKIMTPEQAAELSEQMGEDLELVVQKNRAAKDKKKKENQAVQQYAADKKADLKESMDFHTTNIKYEILRSQKVAQELEKNWRP